MCMHLGKAHVSPSPKVVSFDFLFNQFGDVGALVPSMDHMDLQSCEKWSCIITVPRPYQHLIVDHYDIVIVKCIFLYDCRRTSTIYNYPIDIITTAELIQQWKSMNIRFLLDKPWKTCVGRCSLVTPGGTPAFGMHGPFNYKTCNTDSGETDKHIHELGIPFLN